jgi:septum site-determining protein MinC
MQTLPNSLPTQVTFKGTSEGLKLLVPVELPWDDVILQLQQRLNAGERLWQGGAPVILEVKDRLLDGSQLQAVDALLSAQQLRLVKVRTLRRQTAVTAAVNGLSVDQTDSTPPKAPSNPEPLYVHTTLRSGMRIAHPGPIVLVGDVNPGAEMVSDGDILVWGTMRGLAHAGAQGNASALIFALRLQPTQLRIADRVARAPDTPLATPQPEVAYISENTIHITYISEYARRR